MNPLSMIPHVLCDPCVLVSCWVRALQRICQIAIWATAWAITQHEPIIQPEFRQISCMRPKIQPAKLQWLPQIYDSTADTQCPPSICWSFRVASLGIDVPSAPATESWAARVMYRNLDYRSEVAVPINDTDIQEELRRHLTFQLRDNVKARLVNSPPGENMYVSSQNKTIIRSQHEIQKWISTKQYASFRFNTLFQKKPKADSKKTVNNLSSRHHKTK